MRAPEPIVTAAKHGPQPQPPRPRGGGAQETSTGRFAAPCVRTTSQIICDAEAGLSSSANYGFVRCVGAAPPQ